MQYEVSSGAVVFTRKDNTIYFVIVKSLEGFYGFSKGHIEGNETEEAMNVFQFESSKRILNEANKFIK